MRKEVERMTKESAELEAEEARKARDAQEKASKEAEWQAREKARLEAEEARKAIEAEERARKETEREAREKAMAEVEEARKAREAEERAWREARSFRNLSWVLSLKSMAKAFSQSYRWQQVSGKLRKLRNIRRGRSPDSGDEP